MTICSRCIIPENYPRIEIKNGICTFCHVNDKKLGSKKTVDRKIELQSLLKNSNKKKYECVVPISGGKDSTYILYYLVRNLKLNPLAVYFDNGFATDHAIKNVEDVCRKLNVDLIKRQASKYKKKLIEEAWYISYYTGEMNDFCGNCENNIRTTAINEAINHDIKYIIWGSTDYEDSAYSLLNASSKSFRDSFARSGNQRLNFIIFLKSIAWLFLKEKIHFKAKIKTLIHRLKYMHYFVMDNIKLKAPAGMNKFSPFLEVSFKNKKTETIYFYDYIPYNPFHQIKILEQEVGWKAPSDREAKMDCTLHHISNYEDLKQTGITNSGFKLSVLVRNGMISREAAIIKENKEIEYLKNYFQSENLDNRTALQVIKKTIFI